MLKFIVITGFSIIVLIIVLKQLWKKENLKSFFGDKDHNNIPDGAQELVEDVKTGVKKVKTKVKDVKQKVSDTTKEVKRRTNRVKEELSDVVDAAKNLTNQTGDVIDAVKGKSRKGRKPKK